MSFLMFRLSQKLTLVRLSNNTSFLTNFNFKNRVNRSAALGLVTKPSEPEVAAKEFKLIYSLEFKQIVFTHAFSRVKFYPIPASIALSPLLLGLEYFQILPGNDWMSLGIASTLTTAALLGAGLPIKNIIGRIYISEDESLVRFSFINYWGNKIDLVAPVEGIRQEKPKMPAALVYTKVTLDNYKEPLRLMRGNADVEEIEFEKIFRGPVL